MGEDPVILPRIRKLHREIKTAKIVHAQKSTVFSTPRLNGAGSWITIGVDSKRLLLKMVAIRQSKPKKSI